MTKFLCKTEEFLQQGCDPLDPPEYGCLCEEIEAPNRNKAKWIFIKNNFGTRGSMKSRGLPKISVTIAKPFLVIEQDPNAELEPYLIDGETFDPICMMKFNSLERISKFSEILNRCGVPHSKECLTYFDAASKEDSKNLKVVGPIEVMHGMLDEMSVPHFSQENCDNELLSRFDWLVQHMKEDERELAEFRQARTQESKLYAEQSQKIFDLESRIAGLVNREKLASHAANQFEQENRQLKSEIRVEIAELLDKEAKNAEVNQQQQKELSEAKSKIQELEDVLFHEREQRYLVDKMWAEDRGLLKLRAAQVADLEQSIKNIGDDRLSRHLADQKKLDDANGVIDELNVKIQELENERNEALAATADWRQAMVSREVAAEMRTNDEQLDELKNALAIKETSNQLLQSQLTQAQNELYYLNSRFRMSLA